MLVASSVWEALGRPPPMGASSRLPQGNEQQQVVCPCVQVRQPVLLLRHRAPGQRAHHAGDHPPLRGAAGQILRQRACSRAAILSR